MPVGPKVPDVVDIVGESIRNRPGSARPPGPARYRSHLVARLVPPRLPNAPVITGASPRLAPQGIGSRLDEATMGLRPAMRRHLAQGARHHGSRLELVDAGQGPPGRCDHATCGKAVLVRNHRRRRPAHRRDVRRHICVPTDHGAEREPGDLEVRGVHDLVPARGHQQDPVLTRHVSLLCRCGGGHQDARWHLRVGHRVMLVAGLRPAAVGGLIHPVGGRALRKVLPPVISGAVVMLIGFNLAPVVAGVVLAAGSSRGDPRHAVHRRRHGRLPRLRGADRLLA